MDSIDYFDKRNSKSKGKKDFGVEWSDLKKVRTGQKPKNKPENTVSNPSPKEKIVNPT